MALTLRACVRVCVDGSHYTQSLIQNTLTTPTLRLHATISHDCLNVSFTVQSFNITCMCMCVGEEVVLL